VLPIRSDKYKAHAEKLVLPLFIISKNDWISNLAFILPEVLCSNPHSLAIALISLTGSLKVFFNFDHERVVDFVLRGLKSTNNSFFLLFSSLYMLTSKQLPPNLVLLA
jgi:hypothetical protein